MGGRPALARRWFTAASRVFCRTRVRCSAYLPGKFISSRPTSTGRQRSREEAKELAFEMYYKVADLGEDFAEVAAWQDNGNLRLRVQDDGPGLPVGWRMSEARGVGLSNTRERLRRLYGESAQSMEVSGEPGAGVRVDLTLPFHQN